MNPEDLYDLVEAEVRIKCDYCGATHITTESDVEDACQAFFDDGWRKTRGYDKLKCPTCIGAPKIHPVQNFSIPAL